MTNDACHRIHVLTRKGVETMAGFLFPREKQGMEIDFEAYEKYLDARKNVKAFITQETIINPSDVDRIRELMKKYGKANVIQCIRFLGNSNDPENRFTMKIDCDYCSNTIVGRFTKTDMLKYIDGYNFMCPNCCKKKDEILKQEEEKEAKIAEIEREQKTKEFISNYLQINTNQVCSFGMGRNFKSMKIEHDSVDREKIKECILKMKYHDFLNTRYWKIIADYEKFRANRKCQLCNSETNVNVHHSTYEHHGLEIDYRNDLVILCNNCHEKFHNVCKENE